MTPPVGPEDVTPTLEQLQRDIRKITSPHKAMTIRGHISVGNWLTIIMIVLTVIAGTATVAKAFFYPMTDGRMLETKITEALKRIDQKLDDLAKGK